MRSLHKTSVRAMENALKGFAAGKPALLYDSSEREGEVDLVVRAGAVTPKLVAQMRREAGGLICIAVGRQVAEKLGLPFLADVLKGDAQTSKMVLERMPYGGASAFSVSINHRSTFTGVTDRDRAKTITEFAKHCGTPGKNKLCENFYSPGHVPVLVGRGLERRRGHTELAVRLCELAGVAPCAVLCEMLDGRTGGALSASKARAYARRRGLAFVEGKQFI